MSWFGFATGTLATFRLTRLITEDELLADLREWVWRNHPPDETRIGYFMTCPWCVSVWVGGGLVAVQAISPRAGDLLTRALAASALTGLISEKV